MSALRLSFSCPYRLEAPAASFLPFQILSQISTDYNFLNQLRKAARLHCKSVLIHFLHFVFAVKASLSIPHDPVLCFWFVDSQSPAVLAVTAVVSPPLLFKITWSQTAVLHGWLDRGLAMISQRSSIFVASIIKRTWNQTDEAMQQLAH